jgi:hypothetical protein
MLYKGEKFDKYIFKNTILRESLSNFKLWASFYVKLKITFSQIWLFIRVHVFINLNFTLIKSITNHSNSTPTTAINLWLLFVKHHNPNPKKNPINIDL